MVMSFLEPENDESRLSKYVVQAGWKDVSHLDEEEKRKLVANTPLYQVKARTEGEPTLGAGAVYPIDESEIVAPDIAIPEHWPHPGTLAAGLRHGRRVEPDAGGVGCARSWERGGVSVQRTLPRPRRAGLARPGDLCQGRLDS